MKDLKVGHVAKKKVLEFDEFLKLEGCRTGKHKFFPFKKDLDKDVNMIDLRTDFYQTAQEVIVSIYGKKRSESGKQNNNFKFNNRCFIEI